MTVSDPLVNTGLLAHRGASKFAPENTLKALNMAAEMGAEWVETDVQVTHDDGLVMIHDHRLERTTAGSGAVIQNSLDEITHLDAGSWMHPEFSGLRIPTLVQYIARVQELGVNLQLEFKERTGREEHLVDLVCDTLEEHWDFQGSSQLFLSGFSERCLRRAAQRLPQIPRALALAFLPKDPPNLAEEANVQIIHVQDCFLTQNDLEIIQNTDLEFGVATVNDRSRAEFLLSNGIQQILTDDPGLLD